VDGTARLVESPEAGTGWQPSEALNLSILFKATLIVGHAALLVAVSSVGTFVGTISVATGFLPLFFAFVCFTKLLRFRETQDWGG
jgi:uncharacterized membrane protein YphA (DoxX/SURF4 family)